MSTYELHILFEAESDEGAKEDALNAVGAINRHNVTVATLRGSGQVEYLVDTTQD